MLRLNKTRILIILLSGFVLLYLFALIPREAERICSHIGHKIEMCMKVAAGFPFVYVVDGDVSPANSVALDPFSLITGLDIFIWSSFILNYIFWCLVTYLIWCGIQIALSSKNTPS